MENADLKAKLNCNIIGIDIDENEPKAASFGIYDKTVIVNIMEHDGDRDEYLVVFLARLEHVENVEAALRGICSCFKSGEHCAIFLPSKNALYARINRILPEGLKKRILFSLFPHAKNSRFSLPIMTAALLAILNGSCNRWGLRFWKRNITTSALISHFSSPCTSFGINLLVFKRIASEQAEETFGIILMSKDN